MRFWARIFKDNRMIKDLTVTVDGDETRTHKVFAAIEKISYEFDIAAPIWLDLNIADFKKYSKVKFKTDSFIEEVFFDYLEFSVLEED
ncbi:MAG: hypothetical protein K6E49_01590 [Lachnospiraceae bacterium]|nr:hypothetical protein [Lachnospiraceae bacterium]